MAGCDGVFYCFLTSIFQITFKHIQNMVVFCFQFVEFLWEKYNMLGADEDGRMLFLCNELLLNANGIEKRDSLLNHKNHCCNVRLNVMMKLWKDKMVFGSFHGAASFAERF